MTSRYKTISLKAVTAPAIGIVVNAPPVLIASNHSVDYACDRCGTTLLHAEEDQVHGVLIRCTHAGLTIQLMLSRAACACPSSFVSSGHDIQG
jgi:hypothetical protein